MVDDFNNDQEKYLDYLLKKIKGEWANETDSWLACRNIPLRIQSNSDLFQATASSTYSSPVCPEQWAIGINKVDCTNVWYEFHEGKELSGAYYQKNKEVIDKLIAMGGVRLAAVLEYVLARR